MKRFIRFFVFVNFILFVSTCFDSDDAGEQAHSSDQSITPTSEQSGDVKTEGLSAYDRAWLDWLELKVKALEILSSVKDEETSQAAVTRLKALVPLADDLRERAGALPMIGDADSGELSTRYEQRNVELEKQLMKELERLDQVDWGPRSQVRTLAFAIAEFRAALSNVKISRNHTDHD